MLAEQSCLKLAIHLTVATVCVITYQFHVEKRQFY